MNMRDLLQNYGRGKPEPHSIYTHPYLDVLMQVTSFAFKLQPHGGTLQLVYGNLMENILW